MPPNQVMTALKTVLLVDGDIAQRDELASRLESLGFTVSQATTGEEAMESLKRAKPSLVITEWSVSTREGREWLQSLSLWVKKIILFSSHPEAFRDRDCPEFLMARVEKRMRVQLLKQVLSLVSEEEMEEIVRAPEVPTSEKTERVPGKHILLIEDSTSLRLYLRKALEQGLPGYQVKEAAEGNAALKMMAACEIRMVITDLQMPGMDGETFLQHLQRDPAHADKPVIVLSGNIPTYMIQVLKARPNYRLMFKPTTAEKVVQMARDLMFCAPNP